MRNLTGQGAAPKLRILAMIAMALAIGACSTRPQPQPRVAARPAPRLPPATTAPWPAAGRASETLWTLRSGLNVAALSCRGSGRTPVSGAYSRLLSRHRTLLASAYQTEQRRLGVSSFDREQTRVYNRFSNQRRPQVFCQTASDIAARASAMDSASLPTAAPRMLAQLQSGLR